MKRAMMITTALAFALVAGTLMADTAVALDEEPTGRVVSARGERGSVSGTLVHQHDEWYLDESAAGESGATLWELHLGPYGHGDEQLFTPGVTAQVGGFIYDQHIAPISISIGDSVHEFWQESGMPRWAGSGEGGGQVAQRDATIEPGGRMAVAGDGTSERRLINTPPGLGRNRN